MFTLEEKSREWERRHPQYTPKATPEDEKRYREMELAANIAWLESKIAELDAEMEAEGVEDATAWDRWDELEQLLYAWAERKTEQDKLAHEREVEEAWDEFERCEAYEDAEYSELYFDAEDLAEMVEIAEENASAELGAFGSCQGWFYGEPDVDMFGTRFKTRIWSDERYLVGEEWDAWDAATDDIPERFFELDWSM